MLYKAFKETAKKNLNEMAIVGAEPLMYERVLSLVDKWASIFESGARAAALIVLPRCGEIPILQLALNKADCVFACADVAWPKARLKDVMEQLRPLWILSFNDFSEFGYEKKMIIDEINIWVRINDSSLFEAEVSHVFFSSGSTGIPKSIICMIKA
jgi:acyl-coenzyme A synthetase/AMP-(fatty) acid ligase